MTNESHELHEQDKPEPPVWLYHLCGRLIYRTQRLEEGEGVRLIPQKRNRWKRETFQGMFLRTYYHIQPTEGLPLQQVQDCPDCYCPLDKHTLFAQHFGQEISARFTTFYQDVLCFASRAQETASHEEIEALFDRADTSHAALIQPLQEVWRQLDRAKFYRESALFRRESESHQIMPHDEGNDNA